MKRRNFLGLITAAPAIVTSTGVFAGACDVWVPMTEREQLVQRVAELCRGFGVNHQYFEMQREFYARIIEGSLQRRKLAIAAKSYNQGVTSMLINPVKQCN